MESSNSYHLPTTPMSPGLDGWRQEQRARQVELMNPGSNINLNPNLTNGERDVQRQGNVRRSETVDRVDQSMPIASERAVRSFKFALAEYLKEELKPSFHDGKIGKEIHKIIIKKSISKVIDGCKACGIPDGEEAIEAYLRSSRLKICKLLQGYVKKYQNPSA